MGKAIVGEKLGMTQIWDESNNAVVVTVIKVAPCRVVQVKSADGADGYNALQITYGKKAASKLTKPVAGHYAKAGVEPGDRLVELRLDDVAAYEVGQELNAGLFEAGELVDVSGVSKGKGFAGGMKRHNFRGQPASHGAHRVHRKPGSVGSCATPSRVFKGTRMAGQMGNEKITTMNLEVVRTDVEEGVILVKGSVPGRRGGVVVIRDAVKAPKSGANQ
jgi:large subunit ribosomal protein L3